MHQHTTTQHLQSYRGLRAILGQRCTQRCHVIERLTGYVNEYVTYKQVCLLCKTALNDTNHQQTQALPTRQLLTYTGWQLGWLYLHPQADASLSQLCRPGAYDITRDGYRKVASHNHRVDADYSALCIEQRPASVALRY